jgi:serine/threonine-protein kinase HipA
MSISGYQPKLSLRIVNNQFSVVDTFGTYILKPSPEEYPNLAENEHAIMSVMNKLGFDVPAFGLVPFQQPADSDKVVYAFIIKRFDRIEEEQSKVHQEQLDGAMGIEEKYGKVNGVQTVSYERVCQFLIKNIDANLQFKRELFKRVMYSYLVGNNDFHLRNFGILMPSEEKNKLTPIYDFVSMAPYLDLTLDHIFSICCCMNFAPSSS